MQNPHVGGLDGLSQTGEHVCEGEPLKMRPLERRCGNAGRSVDDGSDFGAAIHCRRAR